MIAAEAQAEDFGAASRWHLATRIAFRFLCLYFLLFFITNQPVFVIPCGDRFNRFYCGLWYPVVLWVGRQVLHLSQKISAEGCGINNSAYGWVLFLCYVALAVAGTVIWSVLDRRRARYERLHQWFRLLLRFWLASAMIHYGLIKVIPTQMIAPPPLSVLMFRVGDLAPNYLLWWFIAASPAYEIFTGLAELVGGLLLLTPRTTLLGAMVCAADMLTVFMLNMSYDVIVKLYSLHLLVMAVILLAPNLRRLANLFVFNRRVERSKAPPLFARPWPNRAPHIVLFVLGLYVIGLNVDYAKQRDRHVHPPRPPLYGVWSVEEFAVDGKEVPLFTDPNRWRWVFFSKPGSLSVELMIGSMDAYALDLERGKKAMTLVKYLEDEKGTTVKDAQGKPRRLPNWRADFVLAEPEADALTLEGRLEGHRTRMKLRKMALIGRNFHWIIDPDTP